MQKKTYFIGALLILVLAAFGFRILYKTNKSDNASKNDGMMEIKVGVMPSLEDVNFVFDFAQDKNFFADNNLKVIPISVTDSSDMIVESGSADVRIGDLSGTIASYLNDRETRWIATPFRRFSGVGVSRFSAENIQNIKKVAIVKFGTSAQVITDIALKNLGVDPSSIEFVAVPSDAARIQMLSKGEADFTLINSLQSFTGLDQRSSLKIYESKKLFSEILLPRAITTTQKNISDKPRELQIFVSSFNAAVQYLLSHPDEAREYLQTKYAFTPARSSDFMEELANSVTSVKTSPDLSSIMDLIEFSKKDLKPSNPDRDMNLFVDNQFMQ